MQLKKLFFLALLFISNASFGQHGDEASALSVYSENGEQFFLVINGINQNNVPSSKIRVEGLPKYDNEVQILFADNRTPQIVKHVNIADPVDGRAVDMTLKIIRGRDGYARLKFHKCVEANHEFHGGSDEYVMFYGRPQQRNVPPPSTPQLPPSPMAMSESSFNDAKKGIADASFDDTKLATAGAILAGNYLTTAQVMELCKLFSFEDSKLKFAKQAYDKTIDQNNYFKLGSLFSFSSNKDALNSFISQHQR